MDVSANGARPSPPPAPRRPLSCCWPPPPLCLLPRLAPTMATAPAAYRPTAATTAARWALWGRLWASRQLLGAPRTLLKCPLLGSSQISLCPPRPPAACPAAPCVPASAAGAAPLPACWNPLASFQQHGSHHTACPPAGTCLPAGRPPPRRAAGPPHPAGRQRPPPVWRVGGRRRAPPHSPVWRRCAHAGWLRRRLLRHGEPEPPASRRCQCCGCCGDPKAQPPCPVLQLECLAGQLAALQPPPLASVQQCKLLSICSPEKRF